VSAELRRAFSHYATGVTVVTALDAAGRRVGMTANSFSSLSLDPPLILWSLAKTSTNYEVFRAAKHFAVHVLDSAQTALAKQFATKDVDRFEGVTCATGHAGVPLLCDYHACFECETYAQYDGGDHTIFVGRVLRTEERPGDPLLFYRGKFAYVGPTPAPSAAASDPAARTAAGGAG
jgi:flavin reductase (DIM6/NTAB) family NADH-FMN oxidoreductase RutF